MPRNILFPARDSGRRAAPFARKPETPGGGKRSFMRKKFFIGIDSDGTVFDSMTIKHRKAFIPVMIEVWGYQEHAKTVFEICESINLYSSTRGIDRFSGLLPTFERFAQSGLRIPDTSSLAGFLKDGKLSTAGLEAYLRNHDEPFLRSVLEWSRRADELFQREVKGLQPFRGVAAVLAKAAGRADIAVISSASESSLRNDWKKENLLDHVGRVYGQEFGSKKAQLAAAVTGVYEPRRTMMIGDAPGDEKAARSVGARFYPVIPGREEESWTALREVYLDRFLNDEFDEAVQQELMDQFNAMTGD